MRVSIYLGKDRQWLINLLTNRAAGGKLVGRNTSIGRELLIAAEQHFLKELYLDKLRESGINVDT